MTPPTPPAPTAEALAAALRLLDFERARVLSGAIQAAVFAVARAAILRHVAALKVAEAGGHWGDASDAAFGDYLTADGVEDAAVAALCALAAPAPEAALATATGHATATAGEGVTA